MKFRPSSRRSVGAGCSAGAFGTAVEFACVMVVFLAALGCGGSKRRAEHAKPSVLPGEATAAAAAAPVAPKHCQVSGFAYVVPGPGPIYPAGSLPPASATTGAAQ